MYISVASTIVSSPVAAAAAPWPSRLLADRSTTPWYPAAAAPLLTPPTPLPLPEPDPAKLG